MVSGSMPAIMANVEWPVAIRCRRRRDFDIFIGMVDSPSPVRVSRNLLPEGRPPRSSILSYSSLIEFIMFMKYSLSSGHL